MARRGHSPSVGSASESQGFLAVPKFTDIDKAVTLVKVGDLQDPTDKQIDRSIVLNHEWASYEVGFDNKSMLGWIHTDETLSLIPGHMPQLSPEAQALVQSVPWRDDGRFLCANYHWVRTGFGHCPSCGNPINYKRRVTHDYLFQTWKD
eukprot:6231950-Pyramimonas_sp.AAC.1